MKNRIPILSMTSIWCAIITTFCGYISKTCFGNPIDMLHKIGGLKIMPPIWIFNLLSLFSFFLIGLSSGWIIDSVILRENIGDRELHAYKGGIFASFTFFSSIIWFPTMMYAERIFISLIISAICTMSSILCSIEWSQVSPRGSSFTFLACSIWNIYIMFFNISVFINF